MPLTAKGNKIMRAMKKTYKNPKKAKQVFYASRNKGTIKGVDPESMNRMHKKTVMAMRAGKHG